MFDLGDLTAALAAHGRVARVVIAAVEGSSPREVGAAMLVWPKGQSGTIGGGALEFEAAARARDWLAGSPPTPCVAPGIFGDAISKAPPSPRVGEGWGGGAYVERIALGPSLGQCCGGAVALWTELLEAVPTVAAGMVARGPGDMPLAVKRVLSAARAQGVRPETKLVAGWLVEPVSTPRRQLWVWGAGHVGRAIVAVMAPLPGLAITWVDVAADRFPAEVPPGVTVLPAAEPGHLVPHAPKDAEHLILTYSHALDLDLCHRLLAHGFARAGLIGSASKWARFRSRLAALGHRPDRIATITCPIGDPSLGKHPQALAIGVATAFLSASAPAARKEHAR